MSERTTVVVRLSKRAHDKALQSMSEDVKDIMDKSTWLSYLIIKGLEKLKEEEKKHA